MAKKTTANEKAAPKARAILKPKPLSKKGQWVEVKCASCQGTGKDLFGLLSILSTCGACRGKGTVRVKEPYLPCLAYGGRGIQPFTRLRYLGCGGKGVRTVEQPAETCPLCRGTGIDGLHLYCLRCFGTGVVTTVKKAMAT